MRSFLLMIFLFLTASLGFAQTLTGPSVVNTNTIYTYQVNGVGASVSWSLSNGGVLITSWENAGSTFANVKWTLSGIASIAVYDGGNSLGSLSSIYVGVPPPITSSSTIQGSTYVTPGATCTYKVVNADQYPIFWYAPAFGTVMSQWQSGTDYFVSIKWLSEGSGRLSAMVAINDDLSETIGQVQIVSSNVYPPTPNSICNQTYYCGSTMVTRGYSAQPATDFDWYWQTASSGTSTTLGNGFSTVITTSGPLYLRARLKVSPYTWSSQSQFIGNISIINSIATPSASVSGNAIGNSSRYVTLSVSQVSGGNFYSWYTQNSGGTAIAGQYLNTYSPIVSLPQTTFYVEADNWACPSASRIAVTAYLHPEPIISGSNNGIVSMNLPVTLSVNNYVYDSYIWLDGNGSPISGATSATFSTLIPGNYSVRVTKGNSAPFTSTTFNVKKLFLTDGNNNYIASNEFQIGIQSLDQLNNLSVSQDNQQVQYFDGLGRLIQTVNSQMSVSKKDIVIPNVYNSVGKETIKYLPYISSEGSGTYKSDPIGVTNYVGSPHYNFYNNGASDYIADDTKPYYETVFESSVLDRKSQQGFPGVNFQPSTGHAIKYDYQCNVANEVLKWVYTPPTVSYPLGLVNASTGSAPNYFDTWQLFKNYTKDENNNEVIEFIDKSQRTILKQVQVSTGQYASTYYIYDDLGNLVTVIPPEAVSRLGTEYYHASATDVTKDAFLSKWAFRYTYDTRGRVTQKQIPGAGAMYMVYDGRDRIVLTQDASQRSGATNAIKYWGFTKYDNLNRPILIGLKDTISAIQLTQAQMQAVVDNFYTTKVWSKLGEIFVGSGGSGNIHGYTNKSYPVVTSANNIDPNNYLTVTYYDNYLFRNDWVGTYAFVDDRLDVNPTFEISNLDGQVTGEKIKVLDGGIRGGYTWLKTINYYDNKYRLIQTQKDNYKGGKDQTSYLFDFVGKITKSKATHFEYDPSWRDNVNISLIGNRLIANSAAWGNSGAASIQSLASSQDGWVECTTSENNTGRVFGLSDTNPDAGYMSIRYGFYMAADGYLYVSESGTQTKLTPAYVSGEILRIERLGTKINYKRNGVTVKSTTGALTSTLFIDVSMNNVTATLAGFRSSFSASSHTIKRIYVYDHAQRLTELWHQLDTLPQVRLINNQYNELGQLIDKKLHSTSSNATDSKQSIDYRYGIRGWLTSMNNSKRQNDGGATNDDAGDYFGMNLLYEQNDTNLGSTGLYNGNISGMKWSSILSTSIAESGYNYSFDGMSRLTAGNSRMNKTGLWQAGNYSEKGITYDLNGNIKTLQRWGDNNIQIDNLVYDYAASGNQLQNVKDNATDVGGKNKGFADDNISTAQEYTYDANGNMTRDLNKAIGANTSDLNSLISYNYLNLPEKITKKNLSDFVQYIYDAKGKKLSQIVSGASYSFKNTDYVGEFVYEQDVLKYIRHEEGRIVLQQPQLVFFNNGDYLTDVASSGAVTSLVTINGESYINVAYTGSAQRSGIFVPLNVQPGERYLIKAKGYRNGSTAVGFQVRVNGAIDLGTSSTLPYGAIAEGWIEKTITIPTGGTTLGVGLVWTPAATGESFVINDFEIEKLNSTAPEYQYNLKDHLGNVRVTFTSAPQVNSNLATFEAANKTSEQNQFLRYDNARLVNYYLFDHTNGSAPSTVNGSCQRLNGSVNEKCGLAKSLSVMPGDVIDMEVYAKYIDQTSANRSGALNTLIAQIAAGTAGAGVVIDGNAYAASTSSFPVALGQNGTGTSTGLGPKAYLNWLVFDKNYNLILSKSGYAKMSDIARETGQDVAHEKLVGSVTIADAGYMYIYLSNEEGTNPYEVYFDDFKVAHTKSAVIAINDYYPFGLTYNSYQRENTISEKFRFQSQEHVDDLGLNWDSFKWRNYQPEIGRFFNLDPLAERFPYNGTYNFSENKVVSHIELEGMEGVYNMGSSNPLYWMAEGFRQYFDGALSRISFEGKASQNVAKKGGEVNVGTASVTTKLNTESMLYVKMDLSGLMDRQSSNTFTPPSGIFEFGSKQTLSQTTEVKGTIVTPSGIPVNVSQSTTFNFTDGTKSNQTEINVGLDKGPIQGNIFINNTTTFQMNGQKDNSSSAGVRAEVKVFENNDTEVTLDIEADINF